MRLTNLIPTLVLSCSLCGSIAAVDAVTVDGSGNMAVIGQVTAPNVLQGSTGVNVTAAVTLSAFGSWHWITGTAADYTVTLPTAVGNAGKTIGLHVKDATVASKTYTLAAASGQTIDGATTIALQATATLVVMSDGTGWTRVSGTPTSATPSGFIAASGGSIVPTGWLECNGQAVSRTTYAALFSAIGTTWGIGDGSTTFTLPDFRRRTLIGAGGTLVSGPGITVGSVGGSETHTLTIAELPSHDHKTMSDRNVASRTGYDAVIDGYSAHASAEDADYLGTQRTGTAGGGNSHNNMQPSAVVSYYIKY